MTASDLTDDFNWSEADRHGLIAVRSQCGVAIFLNTDNDAVIRREREVYFEEDDVLIVVPHDRIGAVAAALLTLIGQRLVPAEHEIVPPTVPMTNAERQARYRQQHRNENRNARNGKRNAPVTQDAAEQFDGGAALDLLANRKEDTHR